MMAEREDFATSARLIADSRFSYSGLLAAISVAAMLIWFDLGLVNREYRLISYIYCLLKRMKM
jgi:hypothetical protein